MRRLLAVASLIVTFGVSSARAQAVPAGCTAPKRWGSPPTRGEIERRPGFQISTRDSAGHTRPDTAAFARSIIAPQYAYFRHAPTGCVAVVVIQRVGHDLGWISVDRTMAGVARDTGFTVLGSAPPAP